MPYTPVALAVESCADDIIERISDTRDGRKRYSVCYSDLNTMPLQERNLVLIKRMEEASERACDASSSVLYSIRAQRECEEETLQASVYEADLPGLVQAYHQVTGTYRPNVEVGRPIYR